jgi:ABC-type phosphate transport system ATPase subunit
VEELHGWPAALSSGQAQRVAVAWALANRPHIIFPGLPAAISRLHEAVEAARIEKQAHRPWRASLIIELWLNAALRPAAKLVVGN